MALYEKLIAVGVWVRLAIAVLICFSGIVKAETIFKVADQTVTAACDPVTTMMKGEEEISIPGEDIVTYRWYYAVAGNSELTPVLAGDDTPEPQKTIVFASEGAFYVGVAAIRTIPGIEGDFSSSISFSNDPAVVENGEPWGVVSYSPPSSPFNLKRIDQ